MFNRTKTTEITELYADMDAGLDADEFAKLERTAPWLTIIISQLVKRGQTPEAILSHVLPRQPHRWIGAQSIRSAARHAARELSN